MKLILLPIWVARDITSSLLDDKKRAQEKASLINVNDSFKKIIIVKDVVKPLHDNDGILTMSIYDFLLNEHSLEL